MDNVMNGFGSNGGEEFLSYLQTGEGMIMGKTWAGKIGMTISAAGW